LISIPVKLFQAARRERVRLHYVHRPSMVDRVAEETLEAKNVPAKLQVDEETTEVDPTPVAPVSRVRQTLVGAGDDHPINRDEVLKGYEVEPDRYVVLDPRELRGLRRKTSPNMEIVRSVKLAEIDPVFFETSCYVEPDRAGEKPYAILFSALRETGRVALARVGMYGREHIVIVRPGEKGLLAHTMFYIDEIRFENEFRTDVQSVGAKELEVAKTFLGAIEAPFAPEEFKDAYREELQALIAYGQNTRTC
jgi:DNA end-binding protein Ku